MGKGTYVYFFAGFFAFEEPGEEVFDLGDRAGDELDAL